MHRLATYGSLGPGRPNHHQLSDLPGRWIAGYVRGTLVQDGWGAAMGYPGIVLDPDGPEVAVELFESDALADHWDRLDAFEGDGYARVSVDVATTEGTLQASIYVLMTAEMRLAVYGTLAPGLENHGQISDLAGRWIPGRLRGTVVEAVWSGMPGYPGLILDADVPAIDVQVFESRELPDHWDRLDAFEGPKYRRVVVDVETDEGVLPASVYVLLSR